MKAKKIGEGILYSRKQGNLNYQHILGSCLPQTHIHKVQTLWLELMFPQKHTLSTRQQKRILEYTL